MNTNQKRYFEGHNELLYYIIPNKHVKDEYTEEEIRKMMNQSYQFLFTKKWNGQEAINLFIKVYNQETVNFLGIEKILSDSITLTPDLFKK